MAVGRSLRISARHCRMSFPFAGSNLAMNPSSCLAGDSLAVGSLGTDFMTKRGEETIVASTSWTFTVAYFVARFHKDRVRPSFCLVVNSVGRALPGVEKQNLIWSPSNSYIPSCVFPAYGPPATE